MTFHDLPRGLPLTFHGLPTPLGVQARLLLSAVKVAGHLGAGSCVFLHCSDGWDRTPQMSSLAQLLLDPHYRASAAGFALLVEKEWVAFGHRFWLRHFLGQPIFCQFLDAVVQLLRQFPSAFAYNERFLSDLLAMHDGRPLPVSHPRGRDAPTSRAPFDADSEKERLSVGAHLGAIGAHLGASDAQLGAGAHLSAPATEMPPRSDGASDAEAAEGGAPGGAPAAVWAYLLAPERAHLYQNAQYDTTLATETTLRPDCRAESLRVWEAILVPTPRDLERRSKRPPLQSVASACFGGLAPCWPPATAHRNLDLDPEADAASHPAGRPHVASADKRHSGAAAMKAASATGSVRELEMNPV